MRITSSLCEFIGAIIGDGNLWTDGSRYRVELTGDPKLDNSYFVYLSEVVYKLFKKSPYKLRVRQKGLRFRLQSKNAFCIITDLGIKSGRNKSRIVTIPEDIMKKGWKYSRWTLRGIIDTDGTIFFSKKTYSIPIYPTLEISTYSKNLATQITDLLNNNNFRAKLRGNSERGFTVGLYGFKMLERWIKEIGFSNERHINKLKTYRSLIKTYFVPQ